MDGGGSHDLDLKALFARHGALVYRRARRILGSHEDAEEATQEVFIRVLRSAERFEGRASVTTWLYEITTNYCLNQLRNRKRRDELWTANAPGATDGGAARPDDLAEARRLLARADLEQARAALYVYLDGMSHQEAADVLGVSKRTVGNLLDRFRAWADQETAASLPARPRQGSQSSEP